MGFPLELVGVGKKRITWRIHIKYVENLDLKYETYSLDGNVSKKYVV